MGTAKRSVPRVALVHPSRDPLTPQDWSGTPLGLATALRRLGVEVHEVRYDTPALIRGLAHAVATVVTPDLAAAERSSLKLGLRRRSFQRQLNGLGDLDAVVAVGTDCYRLDRLRVHAPVATYDDATLAAMWRHDESDTRNEPFRQRDVSRWMRTQRLSTRAADVNCVSTAWAGRAVAADHGVDPSRIAVIGMGHRPRGSRADTGGRDWDVPTFLFVGIDWRRKNGAAVVRAFARLRERVPHAVLHLVGEHEPVAAPGVVDHGLLLRSDQRAQAVLDGLLQTATAFVMPSRFDPSPIAYLEAASAGMPVVATSEGGAGEMLGEGAITVSPFDDDAIFEAMLTLSDPHEARRRGAIAAAVAADSTWEAVARRLLAGLGVAVPMASDSRASDTTSSEPVSGSARPR